MKKILAIITMIAISGSVYAASATIQYQDLSGVNGAANGSLYLLSVSEEINKNIDGGVSMAFGVKDSNGAIGASRVEGFVTGKTSVGLVNPYLRVGVGQQFTSVTNFSFYSIEPGITVPLGSTGFTALFGYRFRSAFDSASYADTTNTWRTGLGYFLTKQDILGIRYDQVRGDANFNAVALSYTRKF